MFSSRVGVLVLGALLVAASASAQGGGGSTTSVIQGVVSDSSGGVLPGVTITASSPSLLGAAVEVTAESGAYRFAALPPGRYSLTFELPGFSTLVREGIELSLGFSATIDVALGVASLQETVTVTGGSPVIDTTATRVQRNYKVEELKTLPGARDYWSLLAVTPGVQMTRTDVGGNRAGTQTGYTAYGFTGQTRTLVEGINTTEGTSGAGFYYDYGSFEEIFIGTAATSAEMPTPGVQAQFLAKSGGNTFRGEAYADYSSAATQWSNIDERQRGLGIASGSNETERYRDLNANLGGPIARDRAWWFFSFRDQRSFVRQPNVRSGDLFETRLLNPSAKITSQVADGQRLVGYFQWGQKLQPFRQFDASYTYPDTTSTRNHDAGTWIYKGEWNGTLRNLYLEGRYGVFGYYFPLVGYTDEPWREDSGRRIVSGGDQRQQLNRDKKQFTAAASYFVDRLAGGSHSFKAGGEYYLETAYEGFESIRAGNIRHYFTNDAATQVDIGFPTASAPVGAIRAQDILLSVAKLDSAALFAGDEWDLGRVTLNLGVRWDYYKSHVPEQRQIAATTAGFSIPERIYPAQTFLTWSSIVPRVGVAWDLAGQGRTVLKANYGFFRHSPGVNSATDANPNQAQKFLRYQWRDLNGDRLFQAGEQGNLIASRLEGGQIVDPDLRQPYSHEVSTFLEHQLADAVGLRVGYVYKTSDDLFQLYSYLRPPSSYTQPFTTVDIGEDGVRGTADDRALELLGIPTPLPPGTQRVQNTDAIGRYRTLEASIQRRFSGRWSVGAGGAYTWTREHASSYRGNTVSPSVFPSSPNDTSLHEFTTWGLNAYGTYEAPFAVRLTPSLRYTQGTPYGRTLNVSSAAPFFSGTILLEPVGTRRMDDITILDLKTERAIPLRDSVRLRLFLDLFNVLNSNAADTISFQTGAAFERPTTIVGPRTARIGARLEW